MDDIQISFLFGSLLVCLSAQPQLQRINVRFARETISKATNVTSSSTMTRACSYEEELQIRVSTVSQTKVFHATMTLPCPNANLFPLLSQLDDQRKPNGLSSFAVEV